MTNPYLPPDSDDDLFEPKPRPKSEEVTKRHTYDGTTCPKCDIVHDFTSDSDLPDEVYAQLDDLMDTPGIGVSKIIVSRGDSPAAKIMEEISGYLSNLDNVSPVGPLMRAMWETLDKITGNEVSKKLDVYRAEQKVLMDSHQRSTVRSMKEKITVLIAERPEEAAFVTLESVLEDILVKFEDTYNTHLEDYTRACEVANVVPDPEVINNGEYSQESLVNNLMYFASPNPRRFKTKTSDDSTESETTDNGSDD